MLSSLESAGLIEKRLNPKDGRGKLIFLTKKGKKIRLEAEERSKSLDHALLDHFSSDELEITKKVLSVLYQHLSEHTAPTSNA